MSSVTPVTTTPRSSLFGTAAGTKTIETQAELLRLEAEIEQLEIEQQRINNEKQKLILIDIILQKYISGVPVEKLFDTPIDTLLSNTGISGVNKGNLYEFDSKSLFNKDLFLRFIELINYEQNYLKNNKNAPKSDLMDGKTDQITQNSPKNLMFLYDQLTEDVKRLDNLLYTNIMDDLKKEVTMEEVRRKNDLRQDMIARLNSTAAGAGAGE